MKNFFEPGGIPLLLKSRWKKKKIKTKK